MSYDTPARSDMLTKLGGGLKASRRRVMGDDENYLDTLDETPDYSGISTEPIVTPSYDKPLPDMYENRLGNDVRANMPAPKAEDIKRQEERSLFSKLASGLGGLFGSAAYDRAIEESPRARPEQALPEEGTALPSERGFLGYTEPSYYDQQAAPQDLVAGSIPAEVQIKENEEPSVLSKIGKGLLGTVGTELYGRSQEEVLADPQDRYRSKRLKEEIELAKQNPGEYAAYGATEAITNNPELRVIAENIIGTELTPEIQENTKAAEQVVAATQGNKDARERWSEQAQRLDDNIKSGRATDADKYYVGLALLMPLIAGTIFGKEAGVNALAGGAKGIADVLQRREEGVRKDEKQLAGIRQLMTAEDLKREELGLRSKGEPSYLAGKNAKTWIDPKTKQEKTGIEILPGLVVDPKFAANKEELKEKRAAASEIADAIVPTREINRLTKNIIDISSKMKERGLVSQIATSYLEGKRPTLGTKFGEMVEFEGKKINAAVALENNIKALVDAYRMAKGMRALTANVQHHIDGLFSNPATSFKSYEDTIQEMKFIRDLAQNRLMGTVESQGFVPNFVADTLRGDNEKVSGILRKKEGSKEAHSLIEED